MNFILPFGFRVNVTARTVGKTINTIKVNRTIQPIITPLVDVYQLLVDLSLFFFVTKLLIY